MSEDSHKYNPGDIVYVHVVQPGDRIRKCRVVECLPANQFDNKYTVDVIDMTDEEIEFIMREWFADRTQAVRREIYEVSINRKG